MQELNENFWVALTIFTCLFLSSIILIVMTINQSLKVRMFSKNQWTPIEATITHSQLNRFHVRSIPKSYTASIVFEYIINSKTYSSNLITPDLLNSSGINKDYGLNLIQLFPAGKRVQAYYNSSNYSVAVLFPCNTQWTWFNTLYHPIAVFGFLMLLPSIFYLLIYFPDAL